MFLFGVDAVTAVAPLAWGCSDTRTDWRGGVRIHGRTGVSCGSERAEVSFRDRKKKTRGVGKKRQKSRRNFVISKCGEDAESCLVGRCERRARRRRPSPRSTRERCVRAQG